MLRETARVCVFITTVPITKLFARCVFITAVPVCVCVYCVCLLLQYLLQSCSRGDREVTGT